jgi:hypothetical protein
MPVVTECDGFYRAFDDFKEKYHRLDLCHTNWDNLSVFLGKEIASTEWKSELFHLEMKNGHGECVSN